MLAKLCSQFPSVALLIVVLLCCSELSAQEHKEDPVERRIRSVGLSASYTYTLAHTPELKGVGGSRPLGITASYNHQFLDSLSWEQCGCYPRTGVLGGWFHLDDPGTLGNAYFLAGYVEPFLWSGKRIDLSLRGVFGGTYQDSPYHPERNPQNQAYSTHLSFFLQVGLHGHLRLDERNTIKLSVLYDHSSNGGVAKPNKGLNHPGFAIGYERALEPLEFPDREAPSSSSSRWGPRLDISLFGGGKNVGTDRENYYGFVGHSIRYAHPLNALHTITFGGSWLVDGALKERMERSSGPVTDHQRGSIALGHEFLMGRFIFSQEIGVYFYDPSGLDDRILHRWGLNYYLGPELFMGIGLKAHRHIADLLEFRLGFSIESEQSKEKAVR